MLKTSEDSSNATSRFIPESSNKLIVLANLSVSVRRMKLPTSGIFKKKNNEPLVSYFLDLIYFLYTKKDDRTRIAKTPTIKKILFERKK